MRFIIPILLLAGACSSENDIQSSLAPSGQYNPRDIETPIVEDKLVQVTVPSADILFVVDNSSSMANNQAQLTAAFPSFIDYFVGSGLDYHIGVVSTDVVAANQSGKLQGGLGYLYIDDETTLPGAVFQDMATLGIGGSGDESGRSATYGALELLKDDFNAGFRREDASLHVIVISDENDWSTNYPISKPEFIDWMLGQQRPDQEATFNAIVNAADCCGLFSVESPGTHYVDIANAVGGITYDIKSEDWDYVLEQLGMQAAGLKREWFLSELPVPDSIDVEVVDDGVNLPMVQEVDWVYDAVRNSVVFLEYVPSPLATVNITYKKLSSVQ